MAVLNRWPVNSPLLNGTEPSAVWQKWLSSVVTAANRTPSLLASVTLTDQNATIPTTTVPMPSGQPTAGAYRLSYSLAVTQAAPSTSSAQVTLGWTYGGSPRTKTFAALDSNSTGTVEADHLVVLADTGSAFTYQITYGSS